MADTNTYTAKTKNERWMTRAKYDALDKTDIPVGTEYNVVGDIEESDLSTSLIAKINTCLGAYPINSIYISTSSTSPASLFGGSWEKITGDAYLKIVTSGAGNYGGTSSEHKIPIESVPSHSHTYTKSNLNSEETHYMQTGNGTAWSAMESDTTGSAGGGQAYYPYYYGVYVWKRTA